MRQKLEEQHQKALIKWASLRKDINPYLMHIPNGGSRHKREAVNLKLSGVKAGVPDLFFARPNRLFHGLWIEMKAPKTATNNPKLSEHQKKYIKLLSEEGYMCVVCHGWHDARESILSYLDE